MFDFEVFGCKVRLVCFLWVFGGGKVKRRLSGEFRFEWILFSFGKEVFGRRVEGWMGGEGEDRVK